MAEGLLAFYVAGNQHRQRQLGRLCLGVAKSQLVGRMAFRQKHDLAAVHAYANAGRLVAEAAAPAVHAQPQLLHALRVGNVQLVHLHVAPVLWQAVQHTARQRAPVLCLALRAGGGGVAAGQLDRHDDVLHLRRQSKTNLLQRQGLGQLPLELAALGLAAWQGLRPDQRRCLAAAGVAEQAGAFQGRCRGVGGPEQAQVFGAPGGQFDLAHIELLAVKRQAGQLAAAPVLPVLQIVAGFDAEALKTLFAIAPIELQALQRKVGFAGVEQPTMQLRRIAAAAAWGVHFDHGAVLLDAGIRLRSTRLHWAVQWEQAHIGCVLGIGVLLCRSAQQCVGLGFALGVEHAQIAQVGMGGAQLYRHADIELVPGPIADQVQRQFLGKVSCCILGVGVGGQCAQQQRSSPMRCEKTAHAKVSVSASLRRGGKGEK